MIYIDVFWHTSDPTDPVRLVSELDEYGFETRKLEFFRNGVIGYADKAASENGRALGEAAVPLLDQINADSEFLRRA